MSWPKTSVVKNLVTDSTIVLISMETTIVHLPKKRAPLRIRKGLNPSRVRVPEEWAGQSAWSFLWHLIITQRYRVPEDNEDALQERFTRGEVRQGYFPQDVALQPDSILSVGQDIWFYRIPGKEAIVPYRCETIYEDENLLVVDKPCFIATMPRGKHITQTATVLLRRETGIDDLAPAHRLDRLTSGILVFTKRPEVRGAYQTLFAERKAHKTYEAIAPHTPTIAPGTQWRHRMEKIPGQVQGFITDGEVNAITTVADVIPLSPEQCAQLAMLHNLSEIVPLARYVLEPLTGRTHQLRLHMNAAGVPILGDPAYPTVLPEGYEDFGTPMHLHARMLAFIDPLSGERMHFEAPRRW